MLFTERLVSTKYLEIALCVGYVGIKPETVVMVRGAGRNFIFLTPHRLEFGFVKINENTALLISIPLSYNYPHSFFPISPILHTSVVEP